MWRKYTKKEKKANTRDNLTDVYSHDYSSSIPPNQAVELGTINYINLTPDQKHGDINKALSMAKQTGKPLFCNFVEWSGWRGCKEAGKTIFADPAIKRAAEELFVPCAFNTWDRHDPRRNDAMKRWGAGLDDSWWGYLRIVDSEGRNVVTKTGQITGGHKLLEVKQVLRDALFQMNNSVPAYLY